MRVLLVSTYFIQYGIELANGLAEAGVEVGLVFNHDNALKLVGEDYTKMLSDKVQLKLMPGKHSNKIISRSTWRNISWFKRTIKEFEPDVVHLQSSNDLASIWTGWRRKHGLTVTIHDVTPHPGDDEKSNAKWLLWVRDRFLVPHAVRVGLRWITHGEILKKELHRQFNVEMDSISVVPHGILAGYSVGDSASTDSADAGGEDSDKSTSPPLPVKNDSPGPALFFGRMELYKGLHVLADAIPLVLEKMPEAKFVIAGRGPALETEREKLIAHPQVELKDYYIETAEVAQLYRDASINLAPYIEASQSGVIASGYAFDVPAIASRIGALPEVVIHEENGLVVEPNDPKALAEAILRLLQDHDLRHRMQLGVRQWAEGPLSWQSIAHKTVESYTKACRKR